MAEEEESLDLELLRSVMKWVLDETRLTIYSYPAEGGQKIFPNVRMESARQAFRRAELPIEKFFVTKEDRTIHLITYAAK